MPHELATTRRVRKGVLPSPAAAGEQRAPATETPVESPPIAPTIGDRVVADVRHEIGNYFHKLYYWADFLTESRAGRGGDVTATQMLEGTIRGLEDLLRATLEYVRPISLTAIRMTAREVADGIVRQLVSAAAGRTIVVDACGDLGERSVQVDPGRLSQVLGLVARRLEACTAEGARLHATVGIDARAGGEALVVRIIGAAAVVSPVSSTMAEVEWATAENVVRTFGGELVVQDGPDGGTSLALVLPIRA